MNLVGHTCREAENAAAARALLPGFAPDVALLDIMMPGEDGFPLGAQMIVARCFDLVMEQERTRALSEEAAIARAVALEISASQEEAQSRLFAVAQGVQAGYGSDALQVYLVYHGMPMGDARCLMGWRGC